MYISNMSEKTISVQNLSRFLIKRWFWLLITLVIGSAVGAIYGGIALKKEDKKYRENNYQSENIIKVSDIEFANVKSIMEYETILDKQQEYNENSIIMQIDPSHKYSCNYFYVMPSDGTVDVNTMIYGYLEALNKDEFYLFLNNRLGLKLDSSFYREVIRIDTISVPQGISVTVSHYEKTLAQEMSEVVAAYMLEIKEHILSQYGKHEVNVDKNEVKEEVDLSLVTHQNNNIASLVSMRDTLAARYANLTKNEKAYLQQYRKASKSESYIEGEPLTELVTHNPKKYSINLKNLKPYIKKGALFCLILGFSMLTGYYLFTRRLVDEANIEELFGIPLLAKIDEKYNKKEELDLLIHKIKLLIHKEEQKQSRVLLVCCDETIQNTEFVKMLREGLQKQENIKVDECVRNLEQKESINKLYKTDTVILIEKLYKTKIDNIKINVRECIVFEKKIVGAIVL